MHLKKNIIYIRIYFKKQRQCSICSIIKFGFSFRQKFYLSKKIHLWITMLKFSEILISWLCIFSMGKDWTLRSGSIIPGSVISLQWWSSEYHQTERSWGLRGVPPRERCWCSSPWPRRVPRPHLEMLLYRIASCLALVSRKFPP